MVTGQPGPCVGNIVALPRLGFPGLCLQDGPLAIRVADYASVFSAGVSAATTWDTGIMYERGRAMGEEFRGKGAQIALGPVAGPLGRSAYSGRNWEGFSPDLYLTGVAMTETITGIQDAGVQACAKHYIGNEQETQRNPTFDPNGTITDVLFEAVSANLDDRTMHGKIHSRLGILRSTNSALQNFTSGHSPMRCTLRSRLSCAHTSASTARMVVRIPRL